MKQIKINISILKTKVIIFFFVCKHKKLDNSKFKQFAMK